MWKDISGLEFNSNICFHVICEALTFTYNSKTTSTKPQIYCTLTVPLHIAAVFLITYKIKAQNCGVAGFAIKV